MRVVSTVHKEGWDAYGEAFAESVLKNWVFSAPTEWLLYTEGFDVGGAWTSNLNEVKTESIPRLVAFKEKYKDYKPVLWQWDIVRWSNKVFANYDALYDYEGLAVWLDCDTVTQKPITEEFIRGLLPQGHYMAMFKRVGMPTETGFVVRDCSHPLHKKFMDTWVEWLESGAFKQLSQWCDASTMDATTRLLERLGMKTTSLSGEWEKDLNPMDHAPLSEYITHYKGNRKWKSK